MARTSLSGKSTPGMKTGTPVSNGNASLRLEKSNPGGRRSTPDSEALASSDDEFDHQQHTTTAPTAPLPKPARRTSWLNEVPQILPRKGSITATSTGSNPTTPSAEQSSWAANTSPGLNGSVTWGHGASGFPWGTGIWNAESRKEPPPRLTELSQSPTMPNPPNSSNNNDEILSPTARTMPSDSSIPFTIPLHPTPKTYRSQSYSVGQLDPEVVKLMAAKAAQYNNATRGRNTGQYAGLQHRSSRPSVLGELGHDPAMLGQVREDDDDEETSTNGSENGYQYSANQARTIEQLTRENALLRQAASQLDQSRLRDRAASSASANSVYSMAGPPHNTHRIPVSVPEEADMAVEDLDELGDIHSAYGSTRSNTRRRFSEHSANLDKQLQALASLENRPLENIKRAHWQTSLGFGSINELPQSRRHSFADIPPRHGSISSIADSQANLASVNSRSSLVDREEGYAPIPDGAIPTSPTDNAFYAREHLPGDAVPPGIPPSLQHVYNMSTYNRHQQGLSQPHQNQLLYIVTFKCHRADVFYIQEDTGLQVKLGDLVIVEADRGTDLGTIQHVNVSWQKAKELKEQYLEEHYKLLMLFSRQSQSGASNVVNPGIGNRSAIGGMGPPGSQGAHETQSTEIKPKLIKRLAQNHEILTLREKEGNEAKAKRVCQQKVADHRLNMEILDAEFQMDWKKLTFYYFADSYINFNSLVTDLFKIYKTRIWMSAINPASFVTPSSGLPPPGPSGNTLAFGQDHPSDRRHLQDPRAYNMPQIPAGTASIRDSMDPQILRPNYVDPYQAFGHVLRQPTEAGLGGFGHPASLQHDPFSSYPSAGYGVADAGFADYANIPNPASGPGPRGNQGQADWVNRFQGLSLGS